MILSTLSLLYLRLHLRQQKSVIICAKTIKRNSDSMGQKERASGSKITGKPGVWEMKPARIVQWLVEKLANVSTHQECSGSRDWRLIANWHKKVRLRDVNRIEFVVIVQLHVVSVNNYLRDALVNLNPQFNAWPSFVVLLQEEAMNCKENPTSI